MRKSCISGIRSITAGHLDIIERASRLVDELYVVIAENIQKPIFTTDERIDMIERNKTFNNIKVVSINDLVVRFAESHDIFIIIRGLRISRTMQMNIHSINSINI